MPFQGLFSESIAAQRTRPVLTGVVSGALFGVRLVAASAKPGRRTRKFDKFECNRTRAYEKVRH
eukprot:scaffold117350_cov63-Phaeocystis_antarctica.AAC.1